MKSPHELISHGLVFCGRLTTLRLSRDSRLYLPDPPHSGPTILAMPEKRCEQGVYRFRTETDRCKHHLLTARFRDQMRLPGMFQRLPEHGIELGIEVRHTIAVQRIVSHLILFFLRKGHGYYSLKEEDQ